MHIGRQYAVNKKAGDILDHDGRFALGSGQRQHGSDSLRIGSGMRDHFHQRHLLDRTEIVQPEHPLRIKSASGNLVNR